MTQEASVRNGLSPVIHLTPGRCSQCYRFLPADIEPSVWAIEVEDDYQQMEGLPNIFARYRCDDCRMVKPGRNKGSVWAVPMSAAVERAEILGQQVPDEVKGSQ